MYPGYCQPSYVAGATWQVKRSLTICFCMFVLLAGSSLQQVRAVARDWTPGVNAGEWDNTIALTTLNGYLYTIEKSGALYRTDLTNGKWVQLGKTDFANTAFLFAGTQNLYTIETDGSLYRVSPVNGAWSRVGQAGDWKRTSALVILNNSLYSIESSGALYRTDLSSGRWVQVGSRSLLIPSSCLQPARIFTRLRRMAACIASIQRMAHGVAWVALASGRTRLWAPRSTDESTPWKEAARCMRQIRQPVSGDKSARQNLARHNSCLARMAHSTLLKAVTFTESTRATAAG